MPDVSEQHKYELLKSSLVLLYTPSFEHFGIVPVEAMYSSCAVIAVNNGGLLETIGEDEKNGILCTPDSKSFSIALEKLILDENQICKKMGQSGRKTVIEHFSMKTLEYKLSKIISLLLKEHISAEKLNVNK